MINAGSMILAVLLGAGPQSEAAAEPVSTSAADTVLSFDASRYCESVDRDAAIRLPEGVAETLESGGASADGYVLADAVLVSAAIEISHASSSPETCRATFAEGKNRFEAILGQSLANVRRSKRHRFDRRDPVRSIQQRIADLWQQDQAGRSAYLTLQTEDRKGAQFWAARLSVANATRTDENSKRFIETVLQNYDWIDSGRFGQVYADHAWILVQHADDYPEFQADVLERMRPLVETGGVRPRHYAYLYDRVAVNMGRLQLYGTQPIWECQNGQLELAPMEDPDNADARRSAMGMGSVENALAQMSREVCGD